MKWLSIKSSILDYVKPALDSGIWNEEDGWKLQPEVKKQITSVVFDFLKKEGYDDYEKWILTGRVIGSLTSWRYSSWSDLDVHYVIDFDIFNELEKEGKLEGEDLQEAVHVIRRAINDKALMVIGTDHPFEVYFEPVSELSKDEKERLGFDKKGDKAIVFDGEYQFNPFDEGNSEDHWTLPYREFELDYDYEEIYKEMLPVVEEVMKEMDLSLGKIKRNLTSIKTIEDSLKGFDKEQKEKFLNIIETKLDNIEDEIQEMIERGDGSHEDRSKEYEEGNADGIGNLTFKSLQKHGYIWLYVNLKKLLEDEQITINEVDDIEKILKKEKQMKWLS